MRFSHRHYSEDDSLQADVMRFMAIVAFCLIAILAMVRQTAPPVQPQSQAEPESLTSPVVAEIAPHTELVQVSETVLEPDPSIEAEPTPVAPVEPQTDSTPPAPDSSVGVIPEPAPTALEDTPTELSNALIAVDTPAEVTQPTATPAVNSEQVEQQAASTAQTVEDAGLTLRFASERDFLRLVSRGKVNVFAYDKNQFLSLDRSHQFHTATPPQQVYELDPSTIPASMRRALPDRAHAKQLTWAVGLPRKVQQQIQQHIARVDSGELHINRYEEVRHVPRG